MTHSSTESEYIAADTGARYLTWLCSLAKELQIRMYDKQAELKIDDKPASKYHEGKIVTDDSTALILITDNKGCFDIAHSYGPTKRTKHLDVRHHYLQQQINKKVLSMKQVPTTEQKADFLTKGVTKVIFKNQMRNIGYTV